jgi:hypothetical protein
VICHHRLQDSPRTKALPKERRLSSRWPRKEVLLLPINGSRTASPSTNVRILGQVTHPQPSPPVHSVGVGELIEVAAQDPNFGPLAPIWTIGNADRSSHEFLHGQIQNPVHLDLNYSDQYTARLGNAVQDDRQYWGNWNYWADFAANNGAVVYMPIRSAPFPQRTISQSGITTSGTSSTLVDLPESITQPTKQPNDRRLQIHLSGLRRKLCHSGHSRLTSSLHHLRRPAVPRSVFCLVRWTGRDGIKPDGLIERPSPRLAWLQPQERRRGCSEWLLRHIPSASSSNGIQANSTLPASEQCHHL